MTKEQVKTLESAMSEIQIWSMAYARELEKHHDEINWKDIENYKSWIENAKLLILNLCITKDK